MARLFVILLLCAASLSAGEVGGVIFRPDGSGLPGARVTLVSTDQVLETRSGVDGVFLFTAVAAGDYTAGASAPGREYRQAPLRVTNENETVRLTLQLGPETHRGRWEILGRFEHETFGGTNSAVLLPDGRIIICHDTMDPVILEPATGAVVNPPESPRIQGCHAARLLLDGRVVYIGGADVQVYGPGTRQVKTFDPRTFEWQLMPDLTADRWYPTLAQLPDGELLAVGGGGAQNPVRVTTSEVCDPKTMSWSPAGNIAIGNEVSPVVLLPTGEVLMTHRPPQLYNPESKSWRRAADFVQAGRMPNGDHSDHEIVLMPNGSVVAIGYKPFSTAGSPSMAEVYDPLLNRWRLAPTSPPLRSRASIVLLPDRRILVLGGYKEEGPDPTPVNPWGYVALTDLFEPDSGTWRRLENMSVAREYHAMPMLIPDGRVLVVGGEGQPGVDPDFNVIEAFSPPYLFRGPRPEIRSLNRAVVGRGDSLSFDVLNTAAPTSVVLIGTAATTHFMDSGTGRYLVLPFVQEGARVTATIPQQKKAAPVGHYLLMVMVDDIPSPAKIVKIVETVTRRRPLRR